MLDFTVIDLCTFPGVFFFFNGDEGLSKSDPRQFFSIIFIDNLLSDK